MSGRSRFTVVAPGASAEEAAAVVAALEQFIATTAPAPTAPAPARSAWLTAALREGVARQPEAAPPWA